MQQIIAETSRLIIRNWHQNDIVPYAAIIGDPQVMQFIGDGEPKPPEEAIRAIEKYTTQIEQQGWARFAVELKESNELIGFCGFDIYRDELDFGYRISQKNWGKGYATEAAHVVLDLGINQFKFPRIVCHAFKENSASVNVIEKLGIPFDKEWMFHEKPVRQYVLSTTY